MDIKKDFPLLRKNPNLIYFDNAATTQKPESVIQSMVDFYESSNALVHRGAYALAETATLAYESARQYIADCLGAFPDEIIFVKGATEGINFIAQTWVTDTLVAGDEIILSVLEHHSNLLVWLYLAEKKGLVIKYLPLGGDGLLDVAVLPSLINDRTKFMSVLHVSNALGTEVDIAFIISIARAHGIKVLIDACQSAPHQKLDLHQLGCDFLTFSGHKMMGPTGIGVLYIKRSLHEEVRPYQLGGGMVLEATYQHARWLKSPAKYEAGSPAIAQAIGLQAAFAYRNTWDEKSVKKHEAALCARLIAGLSDMPETVLLGPIQQLAERGTLVSFYHKKIHAHDVAAYLDHHGICVRSGHYCAQPLARLLGIEGSIRASFYAYNTAQEVDFMIKVMQKLG